MSEKTTIPGRDRDEDIHRLTRAWIDNLEWEDCEYGGWVVDPKRPFGNSGEDQIAEDILDIIGLKLKTQTCPHCREELPSDEAEQAKKYAHELFREIPAFLARLTPKR